MRTLLVIAAALCLAGCGGSVSMGSKPQTVPGSTIAAKANAQLEKENSRIAHGQLTCADVKYAEGATTRCLRTVDLDQGRRVEIGATVRITDTKNGGHYQIEVDKQARQFGETGAWIEKGLAAQYAKRFRTGAPQVTCPTYLEGKVGASIDCTLTADTGGVDVRVTVVRADPKSFATAYSYKEM